MLAPSDFFEKLKRNMAVPAVAAGAVVEDLNFLIGLLGTNPTPEKIGVELRNRVVLRATQILQTVRG